MNPIHYDPNHPESNPRDMLGCLLIGTVITWALILAAVLL